MNDKSNLSEIPEEVLSEEILKSIPDLISVVDKDLIIRKLMNANASNCLFPDKMKPGVNARDMMDTSLFVKLSTDKNQYSLLNYNPITESIESCFKTGKIIEKEYSIILNGKVITFEGRYKKYKDNYVICIERNITKRKKAESAFQQSYKVFSEIINTMPIPVFVKDIDNDLRYMFWNKASEELGFTENEVLGKTDMELYGIKRGGNYREIDKQVIASNKMRQFEDCFETPDGVKHTYISRKVVIRTNSYNWLLTVRGDITSLVQAKDNLENANRQLKSKAENLEKAMEEIASIQKLNQIILDNANSGLVFVDPDFRIAWENLSRTSEQPYARRYKVGEVCYKTVMGKQSPCLHCMVTRALENKSKTATQEITFEDGYTLLVTANPVTGKDGVYMGAVLKFDDVTAQHKFEQELKNAKEAAEASDKLKSQFISNMSHEIRTPLNAIIGFSELLLTAKTEQDKKDFMTVIKSNNELLLQLINDILDLSKIEANILGFDFTNVDINEQLGHILKVGHNKLGLSKDVTLQFNPPMERCIVRTEKNRLKQIMLNLLNNAIKFTRQGTIRIGYDVREKHIRFYVSDTGIGIPAEKHQDIFKRFVKLNNFIAGTGLGLSITESIVQKLGGEIGVDSEVGKGSTFWFTLPVQPIKDGISEEERIYLESNLKDDIAIIDDSLPAGKPLVLIAEDSADNYKLFHNYLEEKYTVIHAWNGKEAVELYEKHAGEISTILMDIKMPGTDGYEATRIIRQTDKEIPIVAVSAYAFPEDIEKIRNSGFDSYISKPLSREGLIETMKSVKKKN